METAILLGIPSPYVARLRNALDSQGGLPPGAWSLSLFQPRRRIRKLIKEPLARLAISRISIKARTY